jgi:HD-GYP domain-containing protein (c-di-GMP phosphodiesterase class II)
LKSKILLITPHEEWAAHSLKSITEHFECDVVHSGKEGQLSIYKNKYNFIYVHLDTKNNSGLEVIRYIHTGFPLVKVFALTNEKKLDDYGTDEASLKKLGVEKIVVNLEPSMFLNPIKEIGSIKKWHDAEAKEGHAEATETEIGDSKFTRIKIDELFEDTKAIFDFYLRLGANKYIKIIHKGEISSSAQIKKYADSGAKFIYFLAEDRADFIGYQNEITGEMLKKNTINEARIMKNLKSTTDKYIEEVFVQGIQPQLIEEGKSICHNMYEFAKKDKSLKKVLSSLEEFNPAVYSHSFLVSFFSTVICKNLDWVGSKTQEALSLGALFHDIGLVQIPENIVQKKIEDMTDEEFLVFKAHPQKGTETLKGIPSITANIQHIVLQHHETSNGSGFPLGLSGNKIFPLAKIIGLADGFSDFIMEKECSPLDGIKDFLHVKDNLVRYDSDLVKSLVKGFVAPK